MNQTTADNIQRIKEELKKHKNGIWIRELATKLDIPHPTLLYYVNGITRDGKEYGGYLSDSVVEVKTEGRNKFVRLR